MAEGGVAVSAEVGSAWSAEASDVDGELELGEREGAVGAPDA